MNRLLMSAYKAMDVFAFASKSETQGMVITEAMAAGVPVVALNAPGTREVVIDEFNGRFIDSENTLVFASALEWIATLSPEQMHRLHQGAKHTARLYSMERMVQKSVACCETLLEKEPVSRHEKFSTWTAALRFVESDFEILKLLAGAAESADAIMSQDKKHNYDLPI